MFNRQENLFYSQFVSSTNGKFGLQAKTSIRLKKSQQHNQHQFSDIQKILDALEENQGQSQTDNQKFQQINQLKQSLQQAYDDYELLIKKTSELEKDIERQELEFNKVVDEINDLHKKIKGYQLRMDSYLYIEKLFKKELNRMMKKQDFKLSINIENLQQKFQALSLENKALRNEVEVQIAQRKQNNIQYFTEIERLLQENKSSQAKLKIMQQQQDYFSIQYKNQAEELARYADGTIQQYKKEIDELQQTIQAIYKKEIEKHLDAELFDQSQMEKIKKYQQQCHSNSLDQIYQQYIISLENLENEKQTSRKIIYDQFNPIYVYQERIEKLKQLIRICKNILIDYFNEIEQIEQHQLQQEQNQQNQKIQQKQTIIIKLKSEIKLANSNFEKLEKSFNENKQKLQEAEEFEKKLFKFFQQQTDVYNWKIEETKKPMVGRLNFVTII